MSLRIKHKPDGTLSLQHEAYRIDERGEKERDIVRVRDGALVGRFVLEAQGKERFTARIEFAEGEPFEVIHALAEAWTEPRSPLPLQ